MRVSGAVLASFVFAFVACVGDDPDTVGSSSGASTSTRKVQCNDRTCATGEVCCLVFGESSIQSAECKAESACTTGALVCTGRSDCAAGEICCVKTRGGSVQYGPSYCATACSTANPDVQLCRDGAECATGSCVPPQSSTTPTNLKECTK
jgi:hypothetical protein